MTNLFAPTENDTCIVTIQDVKDSLGSPIADLTDEEILKYIVKAQAIINSYLIEINSDYVCANYDCEDIPLNIKRATLLTIQDLYNSDTATGPVIGGTDVSSLPAGAIIKESSCDTSIEYNVGFKSTSGSSSVCDNISCEASNLLECYRVSGIKLRMCPDTLCSRSCGDCTDCSNTCYDCKKC